MDDVFCNSSTETVVSAQDFSATSDAFVLAENEPFPSEIKSEFSHSTSSISYEENSPEDTECNATIHSSEISTRPNSSNELICEPSSVQRFLELEADKKMYSSVRSDSSKAKNHQNVYQNIPVNSKLMKNTVLPTYVNVDFVLGRKLRGCDSNHKSSSVSKKNHPYSPMPKVHNPYIQLWAGINDKKKMEERDFPSNVSGSGYVSMSTPLCRSPNTSTISDLSNVLSLHSKKMENSDVFCPFCLQTFKCELNLSRHIQSAHNREIQERTQDGNSFLIQFCPLCEAKFFNLSILPSHLLEFHSGDVFNLLCHSTRTKLCNNEIKCPYCLKEIAVTSSAEHIFFYHILQQHSQKYEEFVRELCKPVPCSVDDSNKFQFSAENLARVLCFNPKILSTPGLSLRFNSLSCETLNSDDLEDSWNSHCGIKNAAKIQESNLSNNDPESKGILRSHANICRRTSVKRELRFSVPYNKTPNTVLLSSPKPSFKSSLSEESSYVQDENKDPYSERQNIPVRVDSLSSADFIEMDHRPNRKRRRIGSTTKSRKPNKKKKKDNFVEHVFDGLKNIGFSNKPQNETIVTTAARTFKRPTSADLSESNNLNEVNSTIPCELLTHSAKKRLHSISESSSEESSSSGNSEGIKCSPFGSMKLFSVVRMFQCNGCRLKFCDNENLNAHIRNRHRGILSILRPQYGCGLCSSKFYENKYLVRHCLQHHTSLLEIRSPKRHKIRVYRPNKS